MTSPGGPPVEFPENSFPVGSGSLNDLATRDQDTIVDTLSSQVQDSPGWNGASDNFFGMLSQMVLGLVTGVGNFFTGVLGGAGQTIMDLMNLRWAQVDDHEYKIGDLQDKTQVLQGVIGYGCRYMSSSPGINTNPTTMPFDMQVGPAVGVTMRSGGQIRFNSKGLWRCEAQVRFLGAPSAPPDCYMDIVIRTPGGAEFTRLKAMSSSDHEITVTNVMPVVIPEAGYTAEVQAWTSRLPVLGNWRGIGGGFSTTRFSVFKISSEVS